MLAHRFLNWGCLVLLLSATTTAAEPPKRAAPPTWTPDVVDAFFPDAREALEGERPTSASAASAEITEAEADDDAFSWSRIVSAETLDTEVKRIASSLTEPLASATAFKAGGNKQCHNAFSLLAVLWAVVEEYDGEVRWQRDAAALRDSFSRSARTSRAASDQAFADAAARRTELDDLIRGGKVASGNAAAVEHWSDIALRKPLMQRMQTAVQERINPAMSDAPTFARAAVDVQHEAQMLALLAEVIRREEYEYWDDDMFNEYADELRDAAAELSRAASANDYEAARTAAGRAAQACVACHDGYRG